MRRLTSTHWFRVGLASVSAAGILTALFALAGHSEISVTLQSALVHAAGMTVLVSLTMPWLRRCVEGQPAPLGWGLKIAALLPLAVVGTVLACGVITLLGFRPREPFWTCFGHDLSICVLITLTLGISMGLYDAQRRRLDAVTAALRERELEHERARKMALEARLASLEGRLRVEATVRGDQVRLSVWDDGPGFRPDAIRAGHGLDNLRGRLAARFGADASLEIGRRDGGTLVTVALPRAGLS